MTGRVGHSDPWADAALTPDEIKALLWATAPYSELSEIHESSVVGNSIALIRSARGKLRRGEATNRQAQAPLPASVSAEDQPTTGTVG